MAGYANDAPAILTGNLADLAPHAHKDASGTVWAFKESSDSLVDHYIGPLGFQVGSRNNLRGPRYFNVDLGLGKSFPITRERVSLKFRVDAFNALNHPSFSTPNEQNNLDITETMESSVSLTAQPVLRACCKEHFGWSSERDWGGPLG